MNQIQENNWVIIKIKMTFYESLTNSIENINKNFPK